VVAAVLVGVGAGETTGAAAPAATALGGTNPSSSAADAPGIAAQSVEHDRFEFEITVEADADARWTFRYKRVLENETERRDFESLAAEFNGNETETYRDFRDRASRLTERAENTSGIDRPMNATGFRKEAYVTGVAADNLGVVEMSFHWSNGAARKSDGRVVLGDVFAGGSYLGPNQSMVVTAGEGVSLDDAQPGPASRATGSVTYEGKRTFGDRRPQVMFVPTATEGTTGDGTGSDGTAPPGGDGQDGDPGPGDGSGSLPLPWLTLAALVLLGLGATVAYRAGAFDRDGAGAAGTTDAPPDDDGDPGGGTAGEAAEEPEPAVPEEELVSDEERVIALLEDHGGRMKQVNIVEETGWSKSKVSMLLSEMEEDGAISKLRIGRENVISLPGQEPDAAGSPFDDED
jgi:hypothetical protein